MVHPALTCSLKPSSGADLGVSEVLWVVVFPLGLLALLIGCRLGDRFQQRFMLVLGLLLLGLSIASVAADPRSLDWAGVLLGASIVGMSALFLRRMRGRH